MTLDDRTSTSHALRTALVPTDDGGALLADCLARWPSGHGVAWYPSAGRDYRDLLELASPRREANGLRIPVHLFLHTTVDPWGGSPRPAAFSDRHTSLWAVRHATFVLTEDAGRTVGLRDAHFLPKDDTGPRHACLSEVVVHSHVLGTYRAWVLDLSMSNYDFFVRFVIERGLRFSTYLQARQGLGMGGCGLGTVYLTPWLAWAGCREMICDGEFHGSASARDIVFDVLRAAGAPDDPPSFEVTHQGRRLRWSDYPADAALLVPGPPLRPLRTALRVARARLTHPRSLWRAPQDDLGDAPDGPRSGRGPTMYQVFPTVHDRLPIIDAGGRAYLIDTGATHSMGKGSPPLPQPAVVRCLHTPPAAFLPQTYWPDVQRSVRARGYDDGLHALVGCDRLAALDLVVDLPNRFIALRPGGGPREPGGTDLASGISYGVPCTEIRFGGQSYAALLDTGAQLGYVMGAAPAETTQGLPLSDHHPVLGPLTSPTHHGELVLRRRDGTPLALGPRRMASTERRLGMVLEHADQDAIVGGALFGTRAVQFTEGLRRVTLLDASVHETLGPHYERMFDDLYGTAILRGHATDLAEAAVSLGVERALDVGAGAGTVSRALRARGVAVTAVEPSRSLAGKLAGEFARGENPVCVYLGRAEDLAEDALAVERVDLVLFAFGVSDYLLDDAALHRALAGAHALTREGGRCWIQPAPRAFFQDDVREGVRYRREVRVAADIAGEVVTCEHRVFFDGALVSEEEVRFRPRSLGEVQRVAEHAGWTFEGVDHRGIYPTLRLVRRL